MKSKLIKQLSSVSLPALNKELQEASPLYYIRPVPGVNKKMLKAANDKEEQFRSEIIEAYEDFLCLLNYHIITCDEAWGAPPAPEGK